MSEVFMAVVHLIVSGVSLPENEPNATFIFLNESDEILTDFKNATLG